MLIKPLPYPESDALVRIVHSIGGIDQPYFSDAIYLAYVDNTQAFQDLGVWMPGETATITGAGRPRGGAHADGEPRTADHARCAPRNRPLVFDGRRYAGGAGHGDHHERLLASSVRRGPPPCSSEHSPSTAARTQIIGVMPPDFRFDGEFEIVLPLRIDPGAPTPGFRLLGVARLKPGATVAQANADVARMLPIWLKSPDVRARWAPALRPLKQDVVGDVGRTLWVLMGAIGIVLLMACANVANLLLVRGDARRQEFAIRAALGASWTRIARQLLVESLMLALWAARWSRPRLRRPARAGAIGTLEPAPSARDLDRRCRPRFRGDDLAALRVAVRAHPDPEARRGRGS